MFCKVLVATIHYNPNFQSKRNYVKRFDRSGNLPISQNAGVHQQVDSQLLIAWNYKMHPSPLNKLPQEIFT